LWVGIPSHGSARCFGDFMVWFMLGFWFGCVKRKMRVGMGIFFGGLFGAFVSDLGLLITITREALTCRGGFCRSCSAAASADLHRGMW
jgi:hypothetical protein